MIWILFGLISLLLTICAVALVVAFRGARKGEETEGGFVEGGYVPDGDPYLVGLPPPPSLPPPLLTGRMNLVCCECGDKYGQKPCIPELDGETTHGYCASCRAILLALLERKPPTAYYPGGP